MTHASIARFTELLDTRVVEQLDVTWDEFLAHLETEPTTPFSAQLKHGGWSPVVYDPPKRLKDNVRSVSALVLDYDLDPDWDRIAEHWRTSYGIVYTTKSHGEKGNRYRVVLPLARSVTADEYSRLWAWASRTSPCPVDGQAKDASRFWYDPTPPMGGWRAQRLTGQPLEPDAVLALPVEQPRLRVVRPTQPPSQDRRYERARAYLAKMPGAVAGQSGHTATFNAVATVLVGFDLSESDALTLITNDFNPRCSPPWSERELEHKITSVAKQCTRERGYLLQDRPRIDSTTTAATHAPAPPTELDVDWQARLVVKKDGTPKRGYANVATYVRHHPDYRGLWSIDLMTGQPWFRDALMAPGFVHQIREQIDLRLGFTPPAPDVEAAILAAAHDREFHPIRQYLSGIDWDGTPRLHAMARDYLGSPHEHHAEMVRKFMIGAAARALRPGCKLDTALMLVGAQGLRKSTFFRVLGGSWHADSFVDITNRDGLMQIHSAWIYELAELENVVHGRAESRLKAWMTSDHDMYRAPYERTVSRRPRAVAFGGSTNRQQFLTDDTGSRRFWIVPVSHEIPWQLLTDMRDQLWAEAVCAVESGEPWWLDSETEAAREEANTEHTEPDSWTAPIATFLFGRRKTDVTEILRDALKVEIGKHDRSLQIRVGRVMTSFTEWARRREDRPPRPWVYVRD